jgi:hypothetical protein
MMKMTWNRLSFNLDAIRSGFYDEMGAFKTYYILELLQLILLTYQRSTPFRQVNWARHL